MRLPRPGIGVVALAAVLAGCSWVPEPSVSTAATPPSPEATEVQPHATAAADPSYGRLLEGYVEAGYDDQGRVATYTVAAGDVEGMIGERLCLYNGGMLGTLNGKKGYESIQPGEVLAINPDAVPGFVYLDPDD